MKTYFKVVTYSGSTCRCGVLRHKLAECDHKHKTSESAERCLDKLRNWSADGRNCCVTWYNSQVEERDRATDTAVIDDYDYEDDTSTRELATDLCRC